MYDLKLVAATIDMNFQSDLMAIFEENLFWRARGSEKLRNCSWILLCTDRMNSKSSKGNRPHLTTWNTEEAELAMHKLRPQEGGCSSPFALAERGTLTLGRHRLSGIPPGFAIVTMAGKERTRVTLNSEYGSNGQCDRRRNIWTTTMKCTDSLYYGIRRPPDVCGGLENVFVSCLIWFPSHHFVLALSFPPPFSRGKRQDGIGGT